MQFPRKARRSPTLNIIPLIDVLVVLLIFYIATTVFKKTQHNISIAIPPSNHTTTAPDTPPSTIFVTKDGKIFLDDTPVEPDKLGDVLKEKKTANADFKVAMRADEGAPFGTIIKVYDAARDAGISDLPTYANQQNAAGAGGDSGGNAGGSNP
ncbi:MAG: biopolymer transporter ExbD [Verrucomicrobiota bacterium]